MAEDFSGDTTLTPEQEQALKDELLMGSALEETMKTSGWKYIQSYFENQVRSFTDQALVDGKTATDVEVARLKLVGLREMFVQINSAVQTLNDYRAKERAKTNGKGENAVQE